jgi:hypothetical protein
MKQNKKIPSPPPAKPTLGQLYHDAYTGSLRAWNGKRWEEISVAQMTEWIGTHGSLTKYYESNKP